jgi:hypothetical protein
MKRATTGRAAVGRTAARATTLARAAANLHSKDARVGWSCSSGWVVVVG